MNWKLLFFMSLLLTSIAACDKDDDIADVADCVEAEIQAFIDGPIVCENSAEVIEYELAGEKVYYFDHGNCIADAGFRVISESCEELCTLGTLAGITECDGKDFASEAVKIRVVWSN